MKIEFDEAGALADSKPQAGERLVLTDEALAAELVNVFNEYDKGLPGSQFGKLWIKTARRARELLAPEAYPEELTVAYLAGAKDWKARAEKAEADKAKAEAALEQLRDFAECLLNETSEQVASPGYYSGVRSAVEIAGFTIIPAIPAQPLKVLRHD